jgi:hypothetical protein
LRGTDHYDVWILCKLQRNAIQSDVQWSSLAGFFLRPVGRLGQAFPPGSASLGWLCSAWGLVSCLSVEEQGQCQQQSRRRRNTNKNRGGSVKGFNMAKFSYVPQLLVSHAVLSISTLNSTFQSGTTRLSKSCHTCTLSCNIDAEHLVISCDLLLE